jgi:hypothetical protein
MGLEEIREYGVGRYKIIWGWKRLDNTGLEEIR